MTHSLTIQRIAQRRSNPAITRRQVEDILERALASSRGKQFKLLTQLPDEIIPIQSANDWQYEVNLEFEHTGKGDPDRQFSNLKDCVYKTAPSKGNWFLPDYTPVGPNLQVFDGDDVIAEVNIQKDGHFDHLYGLDSQISVILAALQIAKDTHYKKRFHSVLYGLPGGGKSDILRGIKKMVGLEGVIELDGTQTTAAGAISCLMDAVSLPPVLIIEEIEKVPDASFLWLLGALDGRAEIRKITARGVMHRKCPFVCLATVNDLQLFKSRHEGAMSSRFSHHIYCPRPSEAVLRRILQREVEEIGGNPAWIEPALRHVLDIEQNGDPRRVISVCLTGRDQLLTGKFQADLRACFHSTV